MLMLPHPHVWIFNSGRSGFPGGVFTSLDRAEEWIQRHRLSGALTAYPLDQGVLEWAEASGAVKAERLGEKRNDPSFVGSFSSASQEHYHYERGVRHS